MRKKLENIVFTALVCLALLFLLISEATDYWHQASTYQNAHQGLWRSCYSYGRTNTELCVKLDFVPATVHVTRASVILATIGYVISLGLLYLVRVRVVKNARMPALACFIPFGCILVGMITYTAEVLVESEYRNMKLAWSYYLGWTSLIVVVAAIVFDTRERKVVAISPVTN